MDVGAIALVGFESAIVLVGLESAIAFVMDVGAIALGELESAIVFGNGCGCDRACSIGECDRFWGWMWVRSYLWDYQSAIAFYN